MACRDMVCHILVCRITAERYTACHTILPSCWRWCWCKWWLVPVLVMAVVVQAIRIAEIIGDGDGSDGCRIIGDVHITIIYLHA